MSEIVAYEPTSELFCPKQESFAKSIAIDNLSNVESHRVAFSDKMTDRQRWTDSCSLIQNPDICARISYLKETNLAKADGKPQYNRLDSFKVFDSNINILKNQLDELDILTDDELPFKSKIHLSIALTNAIRDQEAQKIKLYQMYLDDTEGENAGQGKTIEFKITYTKTITQ